MDEKKKFPFFKGITLDDVISRDLDDGFWIEEKDGMYTVRIFIANVASGVNPKNVAIYKMAYERVRTQYYANGNDPMLPRFLSENKLSLLPGKNRKAICFEFTIDAKTCETKSFRFFECIFKSIQKVSFTTAHSFLTSDTVEFILPESVKKVLTTAYALANVLLKKRRDAGALLVYDSHYGFSVDEDGRLTHIQKEKHRGYVIVQELMILASASTANFAVENGISLIFRTNRLRDKMFSREDLQRELNLLQVGENVQSIRLFQKRINQIVEPAKYSVKHSEHWALRLPWYAHVTSPIRRLSDLINQAILIDYLNGKESSYTNEALEDAVTNIHTVIKMQDRLRQDRKERSAEEQMVDQVTTEWLESLGPDDFYKGLKKLCMLGSKPNEIMLAEIIKRIDIDTLSVRDFVLILFDPIFDDQQLIRAKSFERFIKEKVSIKPLIHHLSQYVKNDSPQAVIIHESNVFNAYINFVHKNELYLAGPGTGASKKDASENAYLLLLEQLCNFKAIDFVKTVQINNMSVLRSTETKNPFTLLEPLSENYISAIQESANKAGIVEPDYVFDEATPPKGFLQLFFNCVATITINGKKFKARAKARNKKIAKNEAAKKLYQKIKKG